MNYLVYKFEITPQTHIRTTQGDRKCFRIPEEALKEQYPLMYQRKLRIERYNAYKEQLRELAEEKGFRIPDEGMEITFAIPVPPSWRKGKKAKHHFRPHKSRPDLDNLLKAFTDPLKREDSCIWHYKDLQKIWVNQETGYIEVHIPE